MFGSTVLEIALGLCLYFIALSLICSGITQYFSQWRSRRGKILVNILGEMLNHKQDSTILRSLLADARIAGGPIPPSPPASETIANPAGAAAAQPAAPPAKKAKLPMPAGGRIGEEVFADTILDMISRRSSTSTGDPGAAPAAGAGESDSAPILIKRLLSLTDAIRMRLQLAPPQSGWDLAHWEVVLGKFQAEVEGLSGKPLDEVNTAAQAILDRLRFATGMETQGSAGMLAGAISREAEDVLGLARRLTAAQALKTVANGLPPSPFQTFLTRLGDEGSLEPDQIKQAIQGWYGSVNDRVSIEFRGKTQKVLFVTALFVTLLLNADTLQYVNRLAQDSALRSTVAHTAVAVAEEKAKPAPPTTPAAPAPISAFPRDPKPQGVGNPVESAGAADTSSIAADPSRAELAKLNIPLKWTQQDWDDLKGIAEFRDSSKFGPGLYKVLGLVATALALTMGAEFWYNLLKQIVTLRGAKPKEEAAPGSG